MLDANADINDTGFSTFLLVCGLHDLHNDISIDLSPETYYRGTRKIDFCLGTQGVASAEVQEGITAYDDGFKCSDHRALFVDLNEDALFSSQGADPTSWHGRGLRTKNKMATQRYRDHFRKKLQAHNILERCQQLTKHPVGYNPIGLKSEIEAIDAEITRAALQAERSTAAKSFGYAWSLTLAEAGQQVAFWRYCFRAAKHNQDPFLHLIPSQLNQHGIKHAGLSHHFYSSRLQDAWTNFCTVQGISNEYCKTFLATRLSHAKRGGEKKRAAKLRAIQQAKYMKKLWPKLCKYTNGKIRSGLDRVEVPIYDSDGEIV